MRKMQERNNIGKIILTTEPMKEEEKKEEAKKEEKKDDKKKDDKKKDDKKKEEKNNLKAHDSDLLTFCVVVIAIWIEQTTIIYGGTKPVLCTCLSQIDVNNQYYYLTQS